MRVVHHQRHPGPGRFSLERVFSDVRAWLPRDIETRVAVCNFDSRGILQRVCNVLTARKQMADVHHVTGDVHYLALGLDPKKTILTIADCVSLHRLKGVRRFVLWALWFYLPVRRARIVTAISESTRRDLIRSVRCDPGKVRVIHCPLSSLFTFVPAHFQSNVPTLLQVGTGPTKNLEQVIKALQGIRCYLWIVGDLTADQKRQLEDFDISYRNFVQVPDAALVSLYAQSDIVIFASSYEGFGLPIIEAQAVGRPVITSNRSSLPEVAGDAAEFVDPDDFRSIRDAVKKLISDAALREGLVVLGRENVKRFKPSRIAEEYASIYRELAQG
jgi:glycosyltransferase involved in cell wall biosynthesis